MSIDDKNKLAKILKASGFVPAKRIFLDAQNDRDAILRYLADSDRFNIKHVWGKSGSGWDINHPQQYLDRPVLASSITRLGILTGGEYVGKDDPVMVGHTDLMTQIVEFLKTRPLIVQGDMNGSHWLQSIPTALRNAVATKDSHPIMVALKYDLSDDGTQVAKVEDLTGKPDFDEVRFKALEWNRELRTAQLGQFEPLGTNARTVEGSYELAKILRDLNRADSPFLRSNKQKQEPERFVAQLPSDRMGEVYQSVDHAVLAVISQQRNVSSTDPLGGIDLRPEWFDVQIKRDDKGISLPVGQQPIGSMKIQGFMPIPVDFKPVNMSLILSSLNNAPKVSEKNTARLAAAGS